MRFRSSPVLGLAIFFSIYGSAAYADANIEAVPTNWRLENYTDGPGLVAWFTGSNCANGRLSFPSTTKEEEKSRFYALILSAKISLKAVGIFYETDSGNCQIKSFYLQ